jgi:hypothetical protein
MASLKGNPDSFLDCLHSSSFVFLGEKKHRIEDIRKSVV